MSFLFVACQAGAEKALKSELSREHPELKFAYSRPGFATFKSNEASLAGFELRSVFARAYGESLATLKEGDLASGVLAEAERLSKGKPLRLHVFERDSHPPGEEPLRFVAGALADQALAAIRLADSQGVFLPETNAESLGEMVLDVIIVGESEWWVGRHEHSPRHHASPGGNPRLVLPEEAPSRAYLKLEEALIWSRAPLQKGDLAVEIGSAPGGASFALIQHGLNVIGIDPAIVKPQVSMHPQYQHLSKSVMFVEAEELPEEIDWLLLDMNADPDVSILGAERIADLCPQLLGVILTLKLNEWTFADRIPDYLKRLRENLGLSRVRATQLAHNRREICVYGLTRKGMARLLP